MNDKEQFGAFLKKEKERLRLNHNDFASLIGHPRDTYIAWYRAENGCCDAKKERILKILKDNI